MNIFVEANEFFSILKAKFIVLLKRKALTLLNSVLFSDNSLHFSKFLQE